MAARQLAADWSFRERVLFYDFIESSGCKKKDTARLMLKSYRGVLPAALELLE